ncbi:nuclease [Alcanivorax sp. N3-2A]|nr:nuclease [Alcanivorax sp. N3-2A]|tara:strand:- start:62791 stop:64464 length:1674 start_codon:yes stop_codon:yes gene_type:complete
MNSAAATTTLDDPFYYLRNFETVLGWVVTRHQDLLTTDERDRVRAFTTLPQAPRALLVRMIMRKGEHFRANKLRYMEIGPAEPALATLLDNGWLAHATELDADQLFRLYTRAELAAALVDEFNAADTSAGLTRNGRKSDWLRALRERHPTPRALSAWDPANRLEPLFRVTVMPLCERLRLMFFGNLHQDWSEFVLTELGTFRYESVALDSQSRPFQRREEIDAWLALHAWRQRFDAGEPLDAIHAELPDGDTGNPWVEPLRHRLRYKLARQWERQGELERADALYARCHHREARGRRLRVLERRGDWHAALTLAAQAQAAPESEAERQQLARVLPRLHRKLGLPAPPRGENPATGELTLTLPTCGFVEGAVANHLATPDAPVFYVENTLLTGLFGLLCWEALFAPVPGAFFHPFQSGPADLYDADFQARRGALFERAFETLANGEHRPLIVRTFNEKHGIQSPFVHWGALSEALLTRALDCIPAAHLRLCFERLLRDIKANRAGLPDLIQLFPERGDYRMIEVKGPGDRLQDNQRRWLAFFAAHSIPALVCKVQWAP